MLREHFEMLLENFEMLLENFEPKRACQVVRRYATWYIKEIPGSTHYRKQITKVETVVEFHEVMDEITERFEGVLPLSENLIR